MVFRGLEDAVADARQARAELLRDEGMKVVGNRGGAASRLQTNADG